MAEGKECSQKLLLEERRELYICGVSNVESFDEQRIELAAVLGGIVIGGAGMKIAALDLDEGKITITGQIDSIVYGQSREQKSLQHKGKNMLGRILR
ncbi:MAG: YabP/YqfC family sporulation protein [Bacillota bacterium]|nr:YabP/YqfC family sporulation protein [Bacillota bacterium]